MSYRRTLMAAYMAGVPQVVVAQAYPNKPIRVVLSVPAGGTPDVLARTVTPGMSALLGQQLVIDNRGGAGGRIAAEMIATATPDGYTVFMTSPPCLTIVPHMSKVPYNTLTDFIPVSLISTGAMLLLTHASSPITSTRDLIARAKAAPGKLNYSTAGNGTANHIGMEIFKGIAGINITHVPYASAPQSVIDLIAGRVDVMLNSIPPALPHVKTGKITALAVTSRQRSRSAPEIPTVAETVAPGYAATSWFTLAGPRGLPASLAEKIQSDLKRALSSPEVGEELRAQGIGLVLNTPAEAARFIASETDRWNRVIDAAKIQLE